MHIKKIIIRPGIVACLLAMLFSCKKSELTAFRANAAVNFTVDSMVYTFVGNPNDEYVQEIPVRIMGDSSLTDRHFTAEVVNDTNTTALPGDYSIMDGEIKAGQFTGVLRIKLLKSQKLDTETISLKVRLTNSTELQAGNMEAAECIVKWTNKVVLPAWNLYRLFFTSVPSSQAYRLIVQITGITILTTRELSQFGGTTGLQALGTKFGDYVKQWNLDHPDDKLKHDDGAQAGQEMVPLYYSKSVFD